MDPREGEELSQTLSPMRRGPVGRRARQVAQSCPTLGDPVDCSPPGSSVHGILQAGILEWVAMPSSRGSPPPRNRTQVFCTVGRFFTVPLLSFLQFNMSFMFTLSPRPHTHPPCPATSFSTKAGIWSSPDLGHLYLAHSNQPHMLGETRVSLS